MANGILSGCGVTVDSPSDMHLQVAAGSVLVGSATVAVAGGQVTVTTADTTNPRMDYVVSSTGGAVSVIAGTPAVNPVPPALSTNIPLALVFVPANATGIGDHNVADRRPIAHSATDTRFSPQAHATALTDSTGGTPAATLVAGNTTVLATLAGQVNNNFASVNTQINAIQTALIAAGILT